MITEDPPADNPNVVKLRADDGEPKPPEVPTPTIQMNRRRYSVDRCKHRGQYIVDSTLATVECGDCGAALNPIFVLEMLAWQEAYWSTRMRDLQRYLAAINKEIEGRQRTKCTHCGNMTAIRFGTEMPRTWVHPPAPDGAY